VRVFQALAIVLLSTFARATFGACDPEGYTPPGHPASGLLRWDAAAGYQRLSASGARGPALNVGVASIIHRWYLSFDLGLTATVAETAFSDATRDFLVQVEGRWYPVVTMDPDGIDECGKGRKVRQWSETSPGVPLLFLDVGYGYESVADTGHRSALVLSPGLGYELNLGAKRALFAQAGWTFDIVGASAGAVARIGGYFVRAGVRL
jgi:hypothetical protein